MDILVSCFVEEFRKALSHLDGMSLDTRIQALNEAKRLLRDKSPFSEHPVENVQWVKTEEVEANDYNPNKVASPEMRLLELSIREDGYTMPAVGCHQPGGGYEVVDGFHRYKVAKKMKRELHGYMPMSLIDKDYEDRMASTIRHNRARGVHGVTPMSEIVGHLVLSGKDDNEVATALGMDADEVLRLKQCKGLPELFKDHEFGEAWE